MSNVGICHPLEPHFAGSGRYQVGTFDPAFGEFIGWTDDLDEAVEVLWTHFQLERRGDRDAFLGVWDSQTRSIVHRWQGGRMVNMPDLSPLSKLLAAAKSVGRPIYLAG